MALSWGNGRQADWLGSPYLLPAQCGPLMPGFFSLFTQSWQVQACDSRRHLPRCCHLRQQRPSTCQAPPPCHLHRGASIFFCSARVPPHFAQFPSLGLGSSIPLHRVFSFLVGHVSEAQSPWPAGIKHLWTRYHAECFTCSSKSSTQTALATCLVLF